MKIAKLISALMLALTIMVGCKDDVVTTSEEEVQAKKLANTWIVGSNSSVVKDSDDITAKFADFSIRFTTSNAYTVQNDPENVIFPSGTWRFVDDKYNSIYLNKDENLINITFQESDNELKMDFTVSENATIGGREKGINGNYVFVLTKK